MPGKRSIAQPLVWSSQFLRPRWPVVGPKVSFSPKASLAGGGDPPTFLPRTSSFPPSNPSLLCVARLSRHRQAHPFPEGCTRAQVPTKRPPFLALFGLAGPNFHERLFRRHFQAFDKFLLSSCVEIFPRDQTFFRKKDFVNSYVPRLFFFGFPLIFFLFFSYLLTRCMVLHI